MGFHPNLTGRENVYLKRDSRRLSHSLELLDELVNTFGVP